MTLPEQVKRPNWLLHFWRRWRRGEIVDQFSQPYGTLRLYESGYIELIIPTGEIFDCLWSERWGRYPWHCCAVGGTGSFYTSPMTLKDAQVHVRNTAGAVIHVDTEHKHIFYKLVD